MWSTWLLLAGVEVVLITLVVVVLAGCLRDFLA
jgi:hypothetical protein